MTADPGPIPEDEEEEDRGPRHPVEDLADGQRVYATVGQVPEGGFGQMLSCLSCGWSWLERDGLPRRLIEKIYLEHNKDRHPELLT
jgi:hypothetical protein